jgi:hypothetical protein
MPAAMALMRYITKDGSSASIADPGRARATAIICRISSEPFPRTMGRAPGIAMARRRADFRPGAPGSG